ncbi:MAG TPA: NAD(P)H-dependent oxidoreductase [Armatimonadota bacterium]|nr:NAD(P)H-dependent oxidoreductase [Armatimonadota bacterium]
MTDQTRVLAIIGSPRSAGSSNSESLASYLLERLGERGCETNILRVRKALGSEDAFEGLCSEISAADLVVFASPLYNDSLPGQAVELLERIASRRPADASGPRMSAIVNSGFPEPEHVEPALAIYERFAKETGFGWVGGLGIGAGEALGGKPLAEVGGQARNMRAALDIAARAFAAGQPVPAEATAILSKPPMPTWLYTLMGNWGWRVQAKRNRVRTSLTHRPHRQ